MSARQATLVQRARRAADRLWREADRFDRQGADIGALLQPLADEGLFRAAAPAPLGQGLATDPRQVGALLDVLRLIGAGNLSAGRLFEGHVNAVKLVCAFGDEGVAAEVLADVAAGAVCGVWNAEAPPGLRLVDEGGGLTLAGGKIHCSGAGFIDRPLVTARTPAGQVQMIALRHGRSVRADLSVWRVRGMRATDTGTVDLTGRAVARDELVGPPDSYYAAPGFKGGAWRFAAVQSGAVDRVVDLLREGLIQRGRAADPHNRARLGRALIASQGARLMVDWAARSAEAPQTPTDQAEAAAAMARLTVERAAVEVIQTAEQALGLFSMMQANAIERVVRDLTTYIRQPFPDLVLDEIAGFALARPNPLDLP